MTLIVFVYVQLMVAFGVHALSTSTDCEDLHSLLVSAEQCTLPLQLYKTLALEGTLDRDSKDEGCITYDAATRCLVEMSQACTSQGPVEAEHARNIINDHREGFGRFCDSNLYSDYIDYASCYRKVEPVTSDCRDRFHAATSPSTYDYPHYPEPEGEHDMCHHLITLDECVRETVDTECGHNAANLYVDLTNHDVPQELAESCQPSDSTVDVMTLTQEQGEQKIAHQLASSVGVISVYKMVLLLDFLVVMVQIF